MRKASGEMFPAEISFFEKSRFYLIYEDNQRIL